MLPIIKAFVFCISQKSFTHGRLLEPPGALHETEYPLGTYGYFKKINLSDSWAQAAAYFLEFLANPSILVPPVTKLDLRPQTLPKRHMMRRKTMI